MRTTLDIENDVLEAARELARRQKTSVGKTLSDLARLALTQAQKNPKRGSRKTIHGFRPFPKRGGIVTNETINALREDDIV